MTTQLEWSGLNDAAGADARGHGRAHARPSGADGADAGLPAHVAARAPRDAAPHGPSGSHHPAAGVRGPRDVVSRGERARRTHQEACWLIRSSEKSREPWGRWRCCSTSPPAHRAPRSSSRTRCRHRAAPCTPRWCSSRPRRWPRSGAWCCGSTSAAWASSAGAWDNGRGELDDFRAAVDYMAASHPGVEIWAAGFSFGSYIALTVGAADPRVCTLIAHRASGGSLRLRGGAAIGQSRSSSFTASATS